MKKILLIDNYDSFTYNLYQQIKKQKNFFVDVIRHDIENFTKLDIARNYDGIVISPGPGCPDDTGITNFIIEKYYTKMPIFGVCLGMQCINEVFGGVTITAPLPIHGKKSPILHIGKGLFENVPQNIEVARYHSLIIDQIPDSLNVVAQTEEGLPMAIEHKEYPVFGVQFHPESFMTQNGDTIIRNFIEIL
ncbi:aminodeoxychorismate/anthranilate synthase component II [bacterium]|nr:aminodeoxychorismate/anthranilate synthase component II [bacterium]